jgi:diguanylate cyclase (GGDEF)-like protein
MPLDSTRIRLRALGASEILVASVCGARILVVDDDPAQCAHLAQTVEEWGAVAATAQRFTDAVRLHREWRPDLVLLDVVMPQVDGFKVAQMFKRDAPLTPVILLTARDDVECKRRALAAGADELLPKPIGRVDLQIRLMSMLRIKRMADELDAANAKLAALASTDALTQLPNRRALDERLASEVLTAQRYHRPLTVLLVDVDHFKQVNDTHGHPMGDAVLAAVGRALAAEVRSCDVAGRYGGEEFLVIAPETTPGGGAALGERLRCRVAGIAAERPDLPPVTISVGVAGSWGSPPRLDQLVWHADQGLYAAKRQGRNCVVCCECCK